VFRLWINMLRERLYWQCSLETKWRFFCEDQDFLWERRVFILRRRRFLLLGENIDSFRSPRNSRSTKHWPRIILHHSAFRPSYFFWMFFLSKCLLVRFLCTFGPTQNLSITLFSFSFSLLFYWLFCVSMSFLCWFNGLMLPSQSDLFLSFWVALMVGRCVLVVAICWLSFCHFTL
jgi:hypothetical protein